MAIKRYLNETSDDVARMIEKIGEMAVHYTKTGETTANSGVFQ